MVLTAIESTHKPSQLPLELRGNKFWIGSQNTLAQWYAFLAYGSAQTPEAINPEYRNGEFTQEPAEQDPEAAIEFKIEGVEKRLLEKEISHLGEAEVGHHLALVSDVIPFIHGKDRHKPHRDDRPYTEEEKQIHIAEAQAWYKQDFYVDWLVVFALCHYKLNQSGEVTKKTTAMKMKIRGSFAALSSAEVERSFNENLPTRIDLVASERQGNFVLSMEGGSEGEVNAIISNELAQLLIGCKVPPPALLELLSRGLFTQELKADDPHFTENIQVAIQHDEYHARQIVPLLNAEREQLKAKKALEAAHVRFQIVPKAGQKTEPDRVQLVS
jgi:hypothetical protein